MCGIHASISIEALRLPSAELKALLQSRGPDHLGEAQTQIRGQDGQCCWVHFTSTVLALRGGHVTIQPFVDTSNGSLLCWNGEAWKIGSQKISGNDGEIVFAALTEAISALRSSTEATAAILKVLRSISGPFAFVFLDKIHGQLYLGRDRLGRRSLLHSTARSPSYLEFSSVSDPGSVSWQEVEADAVYQLALAEKILETSTKNPEESILSHSLSKAYKHLWTQAGSNYLDPSLGIFNRAIPTNHFNLTMRSESVDQLYHHLNESLKLRILNIPRPPQLGKEVELHVRVAVLFSGGLDCTVMARMSHDILPYDQDIDLINVAFENPRVVQAAKNAAANSKKKGIDQTEDPPVAALAELSAFEQCPDRETGRQSFQELQNVCPQRRWRFVAVNVPYQETVAHRSSVVQLIHPHKTEMDLSIAYALYFASRGSGLASLTSDAIPISYNTPARVLLSGLGADELFGGYTRHATAFKRSGNSGLLDELKLDIDRLGKRNLGRDDRVISNWSREARFPYLDEDFVKWAVETPISGKCGFQQAMPNDSESVDIEPGKKVLRLLAYRLGMHSVAKEKKRAIQFGARTAKMETGRTKGTTLIS